MRNLHEVEISTENNSTMIFLGYWASHPDVKIVKWIQAKSEESEEFQNVNYISEGSESEGQPEKSNGDESSSKSEDSENNSDEDEELISVNQNKFSALLPDD